MGKQTASGGKTPANIRAGKSVLQAQEKLVALRRRQRELRKEIDSLRAFLREKGIDPDPPPVDLRERNKRMYGRYLDGISYAEIGKEFSLSTGRVREVCQRVERLLERQARKEKEA